MALGLKNGPGSSSSNSSSSSSSSSSSPSSNSSPSSTNSSSSSSKSPSSSSGYISSVSSSSKVSSGPRMASAISGVMTAPRLPEGVAEGIGEFDALVGVLITPGRTLTRTRASLLPMPNAPRVGSCKTVISTSSRRFPSRTRACCTASSTLLPLASMLSKFPCLPFLFERHCSVYTAVCLLQSS